MGFLSSHLIESYLIVELYVLLPRVGLVLVSDVLVVHVDASYHRSMIKWPIRHFIYHKVRYSTTFS